MIVNPAYAGSGGGSRTDPIHQFIRPQLQMAQQAMTAPPPTPEQSRADLAAGRTWDVTKPRPDSMNPYATPPSAVEAASGPQQQLSQIQLLPGFAQPPSPPPLSFANAPRPPQQLSAGPIQHQPIQFQPQPMETISPPAQKQNDVWGSLRGTKADAAAGGAGGAPTSWKMSIEPMANGGMIPGYQNGGQVLLPYQMNTGGHVPMVYADGGWVPAYGIGGFFKGLGKLALKAAPIAVGAWNPLAGAGLGALISGIKDKSLKSALVGGATGYLGGKALSSGLKAAHLGSLSGSALEAAGEGSLRSGLGQLIKGKGLSQFGDKAFDYLSDPKKVSMLYPAMAKLSQGQPQGNLDPGSQIPGAYTAESQAVMPQSATPGYVAPAQGYSTPIRAEGGLISLPLPEYREGGRVRDKRSDRKRKEGKGRKSRRKPQQRRTRRVPQQRRTAPVAPAVHPFQGFNPLGPRPPGPAQMGHAAPKPGGLQQVLGQMQQPQQMQQTGLQPVAQQLQESGLVPLTPPPPPPPPAAMQPAVVPPPPPPAAIQPAVIPPPPPPPDKMARADMGITDKGSARRPPGDDLIRPEFIDRAPVSPPSPVAPSPAPVALQIQQQIPQTAATMPPPLPSGRNEGIGDEFVGRGPGKEDFEGFEPSQPQVLARPPVVSSPAYSPTPDYSPVDVWGNPIIDEDDVKGHDEDQAEELAFIRKEQRTNPAAGQAALREAAAREAAAREAARPPAQEVVQPDTATGVGVAGPGSWAAPDPDVDPTYRAGLMAETASATGDAPITGYDPFNMPTAGQASQFDPAYAGMMSRLGGQQDLGAGPAPDGGFAEGGPIDPSMMSPGMDTGEQMLGDPSLIPAESNEEIPAEIKEIVMAAIRGEMPAAEATQFLQEIRQFPGGEELIRELTNQIRVQRMEEDGVGGLIEEGFIPPYPDNGPQGDGRVDDTLAIDSAFKEDFEGRLAEGGPLPVRAMLAGGEYIVNAGDAGADRNELVDAATRVDPRTPPGAAVWDDFVGNINT